MTSVPPKGFGSVSKVQLLSVYCFVNLIMGQGTSQLDRHGNRSFSIYSGTLSQKKKGEEAACVVLDNKGGIVKHVTEFKTLEENIEGMHTLTGSIFIWNRRVENCWFTLDRQKS